MKLAIVGVTGSIGSNATPQALTAGHKVTAISRRGTRTGRQSDMLTIARSDVASVLLDSAISRALLHTAPSLSQ